MSEIRPRLEDLGVQIGIVIGGGNIFRGTLGAQWGIDRSEADNIGMLGTIINALMLRGVLNARCDAEVRVMTAIPINAGLARADCLGLRCALDGGTAVLAGFVLASIVFWNLLLAAFNLIPLVPLDGFKVALGLLPQEAAYHFGQLERYGPTPLLLLNVYLITLYQLTTCTSYSLYKGL